jgi:hypothetical protein
MFMHDVSIRQQVFLGMIWSHTRNLIHGHPSVVDVRASWLYFLFFLSAFSLHACNLGPGVNTNQ